MICEVDAPFQRVLFSFHDLYTLTPLSSTDDDLLDPIKIGVMGFGHSNLEICVIGTFWFSKRITKQREEAFSSRPNRCVQNWGTHYDVTLQGWFVVSRKIVNTLFRTINAQFLQRQWLVVFLFRAHFLWAVKELENRRLMCILWTYLSQGPRSRLGSRGLSPGTFSDLLNGSFFQIAQKCNKKSPKKMVPPLAPAHFLRLRGPWTR